MLFIVGRLKMTVKFGGYALESFTEEERKDALRVVTSTIGRCEKAQQKFAENTAPHTLLTNRIKALYISKSLLAQEDAAGYAKEDLTDALAPIASIISKCEKARQKFKAGTAHHARFEKLIKAMKISASLITDEIRKKDSNTAL